MHFHFLRIIWLFLELYFIVYINKLPTSQEYSWHACCDWSCRYSRFYSYLKKMLWYTSHSMNYGMNFIAFLWLCGSIACYLKDWKNKTDSWLDSLTSCLSQLGWAVGNRYCGKCARIWYTSLCKIQNLSYGYASNERMARFSMFLVF